MKRILFLLIIGLSTVSLMESCCNCADYCTIHCTDGALIGTARATDDSERRYDLYSYKYCILDAYIRSRRCYFSLCPCISKVTIVPHDLKSPAEQADCNSCYIQHGQDNGSPRLARTCPLPCLIKKSTSHEINHGNDGNGVTRGITIEKTPYCICSGQDTQEATAFPCMVETKLYRENFWKHNQHMYMINPDRTEMRIVCCDGGDERSIIPVTNTSQVMQ